MVDLNERVAKVETKIETHASEIKSLRESRHKHNGILQNHEGIIAGISKSVEDLVDSVEKFSNTTNKMLWIFLGGTAVGTIMFSAMIYVGKEILHLW